MAAKNKKRKKKSRQQRQLTDEDTLPDEPLQWSKTLDPRIVLAHLPYILFITLLAIFYIWNTHYANRTARKIDKLEKKLQKKRWHYMTTQSELMNISKQSELIELVNPLELTPLEEPPKKITLQEK